MEIIRIHTTDKHHRIANNIQQPTNCQIVPRIFPTIMYTKSNFLNGLENLKVIQHQNGLVLIQVQRKNYGTWWNMTHIMHNITTVNIDHRKNKVVMLTMKTRITFQRKLEMYATTIPYLGKKKSTVAMLVGKITIRKYIENVKKRDVSF